MTAAPWLVYPLMVAVWAAVVVLAAADRPVTPAELERLGALLADRVRAMHDGDAA